MTLRVRIALGFALVALATAAAVAAATPHIIGLGFSELESNEALTTPAPATSGENEDATETDAVAVITPAAEQVEQTTIYRLIFVAVGAALAASLAGLLVARHMTRPLTRLESAADAVARGDLRRRSGLADRADEFGQLGRSFDTMAEALERNDESRRHFLQDAAHELRTPLAVIDATSSAILDGVYPAEPRHIETIRDQARVLARIVDDLRTISLAEGGTLPLDRTVLRVHDVLGSIVAAFEARASRSGVALSADAADDLLVEADPDRLRQAVGALLDNALRHTPSGGSVTVRGSAGNLGPGAAPGDAPPSDRGVASGGAAAMASDPAASSGRRPAVLISVEDTGPGIPPESLERVFERFYQADPARSRRTHTSGLGLSIVRAVATAHGGMAWAENRPEGGARFVVALPAA